MTDLDSLLDSNCGNKKETILKKMEDMCSELHKLGDSVRIFVTFHDERTGETHSVTSGAGNYYAQFGHVKEWINIIERGDNVEAEE